MRARTRHILAVYDICDERRLAKVAKIVKDYGNRVQKSVFELHIKPIVLRQMHSKINGVINPFEDSMRYYVLCESDFQQRESLGKKQVELDDWDAPYLII